ncbi:uncharacterized protein LOC100897149 [Galendromus occidentalis]|uniref:Uncharacterized protein LOC100897149 n=1 Tax=Galendromus occidentalis TaxID=34638 RepID=A0AAJ7L2X5_9ACAR|nr:uncharacterized protein LOC100897149 [Galendromus occidentalis]
MYVFDRVSADQSTQFWRCQFRRECKVRLRREVATGEVIEISGSHSDPSDAAAVEVAHRRTEMKRRAEETQETPAQLIDHVQSGASAAVQMEFPSRLYESAPGHSESFLIADSGYGDEDRILIFGRQSVAEWIGLVEKIYVDGTFSLSPKLFQQVFVVHAERSGFVFPVCYALLPNKSQASYTRMIQLLCTAWPHFKPTKVSLDFELGLSNAFRTTFPDAEMNGCLFHLVKNMKGKLMDLGLMKRYNQDAEFALYARMIPAVAFVPPEHVDVAISELAPELPEELMPVLNYFEDNYARDVDYGRFVAGHQPDPKRRKYIAADERILKVVNEYNNRTTIDFLRGVAKNFRMEASNAIGAGAGASMR